MDVIESVDAGGTLHMQITCAVPGCGHRLELLVDPDNVKQMDKPGFRFRETYRELMRLAYQRHLGQRH